MKRLMRWRFAARLSFVGLGLASAALGAFWRSATPAHARPTVAAIAASVVTADAPAGKIKGRLVWGGADAPAPKPLNVNGNNDVCGKGGPLVDRKLIVDPKTKGVKWGIAYLVNPKGEYAAALEAFVKKHPQVEIDQKFCEYLPYMVGVSEGQSLLLRSSDSVNHNVHLSAFTNDPFNVILPSNGQMTKKLIAEKRPMELKCDIHPWMQAWIMAYKHPFFAVTGDDGSFAIEGVPPGSQKLAIWQPAVGWATAGGAAGMPLTVEAGKDADIGEIKLDPAKLK